MKRTMTVLMACIALAACSHKLTLQQRGGSAFGSGTAGNDQSVSITIGDRTFSGRYAYASDASFGSFVGVGRGGRTSTGFVSSSSGGGGNILARSNDGVGLRCQFQYSEMNMQGFGECADDSGATYDLQIGPDSAAR